MRRTVSLILVAIVLAGPSRVQAQQTRADSANALLDAARVLEAEGQIRLARELLRYLSRRFPETEAGRAAVIQAGRLPAELTGLGRSGFILYHTLYGAFLGVAIPAALDADDTEPYGLGLLVGAPLGFFASRAYARARRLTEGQAGVLAFASYWGTWQGIGWRAALDLGDHETCDGDVCFTESPGTAPWVAAIVGGVAGLATGLLAARAPVRPGTSTLIFNTSLWGTGYGIAAVLIADADPDDDGVTTAALIGGNLGWLAALPLARSWSPSPARVRTMTALWLAGGLAGLGTILLTSVEDTQGAVAIVAGGTTIGLIAGFALTRDDVGEEGAARELVAPALFTHQGGWEIGLPPPVPAWIPSPRAGRGWVPGFHVPLLEVRH